ncbi:MAG TPA: DegQ family serine endoprotease [Terriglobia bacterium]|nr:DegQ family serine endoprotease [Terriglobia bacterium]
MDKRVRSIKAFRLLVLIILVGGLGMLFVAGPRFFGRSGSPQVNFLFPTASAQVAGQVSFATGLTPVVEKVLPAVVNISSEKIVRMADSGPAAPFFFDPFFREFFGDEFSRGYNQPRERREHSLGSGVIVTPDGYLLTNHHVIDGASEVRISLADRREFRARIVGTDPRTDIAVLKVDEPNLPVVPLGDSAQVKPGQFVLAMGNPFGLGQTVTLGIISAVGRGNLGIEDYEDFIQTDAAINPGNSGGALVNMEGALIGINTAILSRSGGNQGIGFAVPINMARNVMERIIKDGKVIRGWLGVVIQPVTPPIARAMGMDRPRGALVGDITPGSPAEKAGLRRGDVVLSINGEAISETRELSLKVAMMSPGTTVQLRVLRERREIDVPVILGEQPMERAAIGPQSAPGTARAMEGVAVQNLTPPLRRQLGLPANATGVLVAEVEPGSPAAEAGLRRGDVIQEVNGRAVSSVADFERLIRQADRDVVLLLVNREGQTLYIAIEPR